MSRLPFAVDPSRSILLDGLNPLLVFMAALAWFGALGWARPLALMCVWLGVVLVFFSIPQSKLIGYGLPALVPLSVLIALAAEPLVGQSARARILWRVSAGSAAAICVAVTVGFAVAHPNSSRPLAMALLTRHVQGGVAFIDEYRYDLPFYLRDTAPVRVLADWNPAEVRQHDNWRKEIADAGNFAPEAAKTRLIDESGFRADLCSGRIHWVMAQVDSVRRYPYLRQAEQVATERDSALWHIDASNQMLSAAIGCSSLALGLHGRLRPVDAGPAGCGNGTGLESCCRPRLRPIRSAVVGWQGCPPAGQEEGVH